MCGKVGATGSYCIPHPRQLPRQPLRIQLDPIVTRSIRHIKHMHCSPALHGRVAQANLAYHHFAPIRPPKLQWHTWVEPRAKFRQHVYPFVQKDFIIHANNLQRSYLENEFQIVRPFSYARSNALNPKTMMNATGGTLCRKWPVCIAGCSFIIY